MQLIEVERIDALLEEGRDMQRARLTNLAVNGTAQTNLAHAEREFYGRLRGAPRDEVRVPSRRVLSQEEMQAEADRLMALTWGPARSTEIN